MAEGPFTQTIQVSMAHQDRVRIDRLIKILEEAKEQKQIVIHNHYPEENENNE